MYSNKPKHDFYRDKESSIAYIDSSGIAFEIDLGSRYVGVNAPDVSDLHAFGETVDRIAFTTRWYGNPTAPAFSPLGPRLRVVRLPNHAFQVHPPPECTVFPKPPHPGPL